MDHTCRNSNDPFAQLSANGQAQQAQQAQQSQLMSSLQKADVFSPISVTGVLPTYDLMLNFASKSFLNFDSIVFTNYIYFFPCQSFQPPLAPVPIQPPLSTWMSIPANVNHLSASAGGIGFGSPANPGSFILLSSFHILYYAFWIIIDI